ncbi:MAG: diacylglycerol/lipid kinase family protein [Myxococcota bacterium]
MTDPDRPFLLVVNPHAGAGRAGARLPELASALHADGGRFDVARTAGPGHASELVREALRAGTPGVAVVGGDGTVNEAVNGFFDDRCEPVAPEAWLAPLPCGTGGDFRRTLGISRRTRTMAARMMAARPRPVDVGLLRYHGHDGRRAHRFFLNIASFGIGGLVDELVNDAPKWMGGTPAFLLGTLRAMRRYRNQRVRIRLDDGAARETRVLNCAVANGQYFGGGMHIAPQARIDDGAFDVVGLETTSFAQQTRLTPHLYRGTLLGKPGVTWRRAQRVHAEPVEPGESVLLDVDGEAPGRLPAVFEMRPAALRLRG